MEFIELDGINKLLNLLEKTIKTNKESSKIQFLNQI